MTSRAPFHFLDLTEIQKTAVYHRIDLWQKFKLRPVARIFHQRPAHHFLMGTRFGSSICVSKPKAEAAFPRLHPCNQITISTDSGRMSGRTDVDVRVGHFGTHLELIFWDVHRMSFDVTTKRFESEGDEIAFINRLLAPVPEQMVSFCYSSRENVGGGPVRDALDVLRGPFGTGQMAETAEEFKAMLRAERQLARQPTRFSLSFGDGATAWRPPVTDGEYGLIFAEVLELRTNIPEYILPEKLRELLKAQIGPNDEATAYRHTQFSEENDSYEATRFDHIHIYVAQNRRGVGIEAVKVRNGHKLVKERDECVPIPWR
ncbi:unnamed protein product, partial [Mesorhabditis spiculigera]